MTLDPGLVANAGAVSLALAAGLWALGQRRASARRIRELEAALDARGPEGGDALAETFNSAVLTVQPNGATLALGADSLAACARALELDAHADAATVYAALRAADPEHARRLDALVARGEPYDFEARRGGGAAVAAEGRASGATAWLRLSLHADAGLPSAARFAAFLDGQDQPAWLVDAKGRLAWANRAWLAGAEAPDVEAAAARGLSFDRGVSQVAEEAVAGRARREGLRWVAVAGRRRAFQVVAAPLEGGGAAAMALDVTEAEETREALRRHVASHDDTLNRLADAVAIFAPDKRLAFHNTAFAELWALEPAWLAESPSHGEVLDRLRQRRRLPESADYRGWRDRELAFYAALEPTPDELWSLPDGRTLRVVRQPHPFGGLLLLFSDITGELKLRAPVQRAGAGAAGHAGTKLNDAVAVFGSDGPRLRLHNEAFERFWNIGPQGAWSTRATSTAWSSCASPWCTTAASGASSRRGWPTPTPRRARAIAGEIRTSDRRTVVFQTRPLPDGATLIAFDDVTATRELEQALVDREGALADAQRL